jgi:hypothetical protein
MSFAATFRVPLLSLVLGVAAALTSAAGHAADTHFVVNNAGSAHASSPGSGACAGNGVCTLTAAIEDGNFISGSHPITFAANVTQINLTADIAELRAKFTITGAFPARTVVNGAGVFKCFSLNDSGDPNTGHGYNDGSQSGGADGSTIQNMVIQNCNSHGISANGHGYTFKNNLIGTNSTGTATSLTLRNKGSGISISASRVYSNESNSFLSNLNSSLPGQPLDNSQISNFASQFSTVLANALLGPVTIDGNVLSGNQNHGIDVFSQNLAGVWIKNNKIGTDITGNLAVPNEQSGISFTGEPFANIIGPDNVISGNLQHGISMQPGAVAMPNFIMGNRIGLAALQVGANVGNGRSGIYVDTHPQDDVNSGMFNPSMIALIIGPANVVSDNQQGPNSADPDTYGDDGAGIIVTGASAGIKIKGNTVGLAEFPPGTPISSINYGNAGDGITVTVKDVEIGGSAPTDANIIASNGRHGIFVKGTGVTGTKILGNFIGVHPGFPNDLTLGNKYDGIHVFGASTSFIGGSGATDFNTIAANRRNGVKLRKSGTGYDNGWGHLLQRNRIYGNGISLEGVGIDHDYTEDAQDLPHSEVPQNYVNLDQSPATICTGNVGDPPACSGAAGPGDGGGTTTIKWTMTSHGPSVPATQYRAEFFKIDGPSVNASTSMTFLGEQIVDVDGATGALIGCPNGLCTATIGAPSGGSRVVMTVTDITQIANVVGGGWFQVIKCIVFASCNVNNTSEFSNVVEAVVVPVDTTTTVTNVAPNPIVYGQPNTATATVTAVSGNTAPTGSVTINVGASSCSAALGGAVGLTASASCQPAPAPAVPGAAVTATYAGTAQFNGSNGGGASLTVNQASTTTTLVSDLPDPSLQGAAFIVTATVAAVAPSTGTPAGSIVVGDGVDSCTITLPATTCNLTLTTAGARMLTAQYGGDSNFTGSAAASAAHQVDSSGGLTATTTAVTALVPQSSVFGQTVAATVTVSSAVTSPLGNVTVTAGGSACNGVLAVATATTSTATCDLAPALPVGMTIVSATYSGNVTFAPSASSVGGNLTATVAKSPTTTSIGTHLPNPSNAGGAIAVAATVVASGGGAGTPTGTITVASSPGNETCTITLPATSCNVTPVNAGAITLTATYNGDGNFNGSTSAGVSHTVNPGGATATTTAVTQVNPTSAVFGQPVQVTATVTATSGANAPAGNVTISAGGSGCVAVLGASMTLAATGTCTLSPAPSASGNAYTVIAAYAGNATFAPSSSDPGSNGALTVNKANATTTIVSDVPDPSNVNAPVTVTVSTAAVAPGAGTRTGTITVKSDSPITDQCTITLPATSCAITLTTTGAKTLTATYNGDGNFNASTSAGAAHQVNAGGGTPTTATITIVQPQGSANSTPTATSVFGQPVAVTATVTAGSGAVAPDGTITISANGSVCSVALGSPVGLTSKGTCTLAPASIPVSGLPYPVSVGYAGTATFAASSASNGSLTVNKAATTTTISSDTPDPSSVNSPIAVTAGVVVTAPGAGTPSGSIVVTSAPGGETCTITLPATSCNVTPLSSGGTTLTAVYGGDANFANSTSPGVPHTVSGGGAIATATVVTQVTPASIVFGQPYSVTASVTAASGATAPNGNVTIMAGASSCTVPLGSPNGLTSTGTCQPLPALSPAGGAYVVSATYAGTPTFAPSASSGGSNGNLTVAKAATTVMIAPSPSPSFVLAPVQVTATLLPVAPGAGTPTGTILVSDGSISCTITLPATSCTLTFPSSGARTLTATYSGDVNFNGTAASVGHTVNALTTLVNVPTAVNGVTASVTLSGAAGCSFVNPAFVPEPVSPPPNIVLPFGMFQFETTGCGTGGTITVQIVYSQPIPGGSQYWKYGPTPGDASQHWYVLPTASFNGNTVTFTITDGQIGDDDLSANGTIVDQGGPGFRINTVIPTLSGSMRIVLGLLLAVLAGLMLRRRRA